MQNQIPEKHKCDSEGWILQGELFMWENCGGDLYYKLNPSTFEYFKNEANLRLVFTPEDIQEVDNVRMGTAVCSICKGWTINKSLKEGI